MAKNEKEGKLVSLSGAPIWEHGEAKPWEAPHGESCLEEITEHIEEHLGPIAMVFHEVVSDTVHIDVHHVEPTLHSLAYRVETDPSTAISRCAAGNGDGNAHCAHCWSLLTPSTSAKKSSGSNVALIATTA